MKMINLRLLVLSFTVLGLAVQPVRASELNQTTTLMDEEKPVPAAPVAQSDQPQFAQVIDDLPLMPGLQLEQNNDVLFVTPRDGRIAKTEAIGPVDIDDIYRFYRKTLPQLGWKSVDARSFSRENEILRIDAKADDKSTRVIFSVIPADK